MFQAKTEHMLLQNRGEKGTPVMRTLFYEFPQDPKAWEIEDEYFYGPDILVAPVLEAGAKKRRVYLPGEGVCWRDSESGVSYEGGQWIEAEVTLESMPVFIREQSL